MNVSGFLSSSLIFAATGVLAEPTLERGTYLVPPAAIAAVPWGPEDLCPTCICRSLGRGDARVHRDRAEYHARKPRV